MSIDMPCERCANGERCQLFWWALAGLISEANDARRAQKEAG